MPRAGSNRLPELQYEPAMDRAIFEKLIKRVRHLMQSSKGAEWVKGAP